MNERRYANEANEGVNNRASEYIYSNEIQMNTYMNNQIKTGGGNRVNHYGITIYRNTNDN